MPRYPSNEELVKELWGVTHCQMCGEPLRTEDEVGEFVKMTSDVRVFPKDVVEVSNYEHHLIGHAQCGISAKYELA